MGLSFHDEASMVEVVGSFLYFTPDGSDSNSISEMGSISLERDESDDYIGGRDDIQMKMAERRTYSGERLHTQAARSEDIVVIVGREQLTRLAL